MNATGAADRFPVDCPSTHLVLERVAEASLFGEASTSRRRLLDRAAERGAFPILYRYLTWRGESLAPTARSRWVRHVARLALYRTELARTVTVLSSATPMVVLKGEPLAKLLFGDGRLRNTTDMDLLIAPDSVDEAIALLEPLGYRPVREAAAKTWAYNQVALVHERFGTIVELHWRIAFPHLNSPSAVELLERTYPVAIGDGGAIETYETLRPELLFLHLCYHFHQHCGFFKGLLDVAGWLDRFEHEADLDEIARLADRLGVGGVVQWPLHTLAQLTGHRSRLLRGDIDVCVRAWAAYSAAKIERDFVEVRPQAAVGRWLDQNSFGAKVLTTVGQGLSMSVADGWRRKAITGIKPMVLGPHRLGRAVFAGLQRLGWADRRALYEDRIFG